MSRTLTGWSFWGTRGSRGTEAPARQPGTRVNPLQRAGPIRVRAEIPSVTRKRAFLNHASFSGKNDELTLEDSAFGHRLRTPGFPRQSMMNVTLRFIHPPGLGLPDFRLGTTSDANCDTGYIPPLNDELTPAFPTLTVPFSTHYSPHRRWGFCLSDFISVVRENALRPHLRGSGQSSISTWSDR